MEELAANLPNVHISTSSASDMLSIRGIGSSDVTGGFEQSVGIFVDGVHRGRSRLSRSMLFDVDRVEVLRGPQGTFFGNNTIAGALSVITRKPGDETEGYVTALYEPDHGEHLVDLAMGGPLTDTFGVRVAVRKAGMSGYLNESGDGTIPDDDDKVGRITAAWTPTDRFDATFKAAYTELEHGGAEFAANPLPA